MGMKRNVEFGGVVMPHVVVKLWPGRNDEIKTNLAKKIADAVVEELKVDIDDVSVAFEEVSRSDWGEQVYKKEIRDNKKMEVLLKASIHRARNRIKIANNQ